MILCNPCNNTEMKCIKTGMKVLYDDNHYAHYGDKYECPKCLKTIVIASGSGQSYQNPLKVDEHDIEMKS